MGSEHYKLYVSVLSVKLAELVRASAGNVKVKGSISIDLGRHNNDLE